MRYFMRYFTAGYLWLLIRLGPLLLYVVIFEYMYRLTMGYLKTIYENFSYSGQVQEETVKMMMPADTYPVRPSLASVGISLNHVCVCVL